MRGSHAARGVLLACALPITACGSHSAGAGSANATGAAPSSSATSTRVAPAADGDWTRFDYDAQRSGAGPASTGITAANVRALQRRVVRIDGVADSSAIQLHSVRVGGRLRDVVVVTTTYGRTIAIDPGTGAKLWEYVPPDISSFQRSYQVTTASPVADPSRAYVYAATPDGQIHKLALAGGHQVWATRITSDPAREKIGTALNTSGPYVVATTGGYYGDAPTYQGHVALIVRATGRVAHLWNSLCSNRHYLLDPPSSCSASDSAIWARSGAVIEPGAGRILVATGNGPFNGSTDWGDSVLELTPDASRLLQNWTPTDQAQLNNSDGDLGSSAPALLPGGLVLQAAKDGIVRLLDLARLNGTGTASPRTGGELQRISAPGPTDVFTAPAVWTHAGRTYVFLADGAGTVAYALGADRRLQVAWQDGTAGTSPVVAGGLLYVYDPGGALVIRQPTSGRILASLSSSSGHWSSPIVIGGRIVLPVGGSTSDNATSGVIDIFHLPGR